MLYSEKRKPSSTCFTPRRESHPPHALLREEKAILHMLYSEKRKPSSTCFAPRRESHPPLKNEAMIECVEFIWSMFRRHTTRPKKRKKSNAKETGIPWSVWALWKVPSLLCLFGGPKRCLEAARACKVAPSSRPFLRACYVGTSTTAIRTNELSRHVSLKRM